MRKKTIKKNTAMSSSDGEYDDDKAAAIDEDAAEMHLAGLSEDQFAHLE